MCGSLDIQSKGLSSFGRLQNQRLGIKTRKVVTTSESQTWWFSQGGGYPRSTPETGGIVPKEAWRRAGCQSRLSTLGAVHLYMHTMYPHLQLLNQKTSLWKVGWSPGCNRHLASSDFNPPSTEQNSEHQSSLPKERFFQIKVTNPRSAVALHSFQQNFKYIEGI